MSVTDFLFDGKPPTPVTLTGTQVTQLPEWYTQYTTDMLARAQALADRPYTPYTGPRIAGFTPDEKAGFEATKKAAGAYQPFLSKAGETLGEAGKITGMGAAAGDFAKASALSGAGAAKPYLGKAEAMSGMGAASPYFASGVEAIQKAGAGSSLAAAQPYLEGAGATFPGMVQQYMSPYIQGVVEQIGDIGVRQLKEKYLPEIGQEFIGAGQFSVGPGSSRMGEFSSRALRDVQQSVLGEQAKALQAGYGQAAEIFGRDASRLLEAAGLSGKLSSDDLNRLLESGVRVADIGAKAGQLTSDDAARLIDIGKTTGTLTQQDAEQLARIAESKGKLSLEDAAALRDLSTKYLGVGEAEQELGLKGAEAVTGVGEKERAMRQASLNLAYEDFLRQEGYPEERVKFLASILSGVQIPKTEITTKQELPDEDLLQTDISKYANAYKVLDEILKGESGSDLLNLLKKVFGGG
jgi:hypothetical protein